MTRAEFIGRVVQSLANNAIKREAMDAICEAVRIVHGDVATTYARQLLMRHRKRAGRHVDHARKRRIAEAAHMARFNRGIGREIAARQAAERFKVLFSEVFSAAFGDPKKEMRGLIRTVRATRPKYLDGSQNKNSVMNGKLL